MSSASDKSASAQSTSDLSEDFVLVDDGQVEATAPPKGQEGLPLRRSQRLDKKGTECQMEIHPLSGSDKVLVSITPPTEPEMRIKHVPVDVVLVIDVSGSMTAAAPLPDTNDDNEKEATGLSILDLTKHASRTIIETLNDSDRLGIVTFSEDAEVIQELIKMSPDARKESWSRVERLTTQGSTNLWAGIRTGLSLYGSSSTATPSLLVLTDGMPNHMCPKQGYVNKLRPMLSDMPRAPTINTFGFGYSIRSTLLQSIAEVGQGNYAFIPDAGMIGTVFVHAVANLYNTFASNAVLEIKTHPRTALTCNTVFNTMDTKNGDTRFQLGNLQYGQSRDLILDLDRSAASGDVNITARLTLQMPILGSSDEINQPIITAGATTATKSRLPQAYTSYHLYRSELCSLLSQFTPLSQSTNEHTILNAYTESSTFSSLKDSLHLLASTIRSSPHATDPNIASLLLDICGADPAGQITKALQTGELGLDSHEFPDKTDKNPHSIANTKHFARYCAASEKSNYYARWGQHYLPSLLHAHARQLCNTFKDPGPLRYGVDAPLFVKCRDELDAAFDALPAPKPSRAAGEGGYTRVRMGRFHAAGNPCWSGGSEVRLAEGARVRVDGLRNGMRVWTPRGQRTVVGLLRTRFVGVSGEAGEEGVLCRVGKLWVTPWHPVCLEGVSDWEEGAWVFPQYFSEEVKACEEDVFSILLEKDDDPQAHCVEVAGIKSATLGHGLLGVWEDVRAHEFFGDRNKVMVEMLRLPVDEMGRRVTSGVKRGCDGMVDGFEAPVRPAQAGSYEGAGEKLIAHL